MAEEFFTITTMFILFILFGFIITFGIILHAMWKNIKAVYGSIK